MFNNEESTNLLFFTWIKLYYIHLKLNKAKNIVFKYMGGICLIVTKPNIANIFAFSVKTKCDQGIQIISVISSHQLNTQTFEFELNVKFCYFVIFSLANIFLLFYYSYIDLLPIWYIHSLCFLLSNLLSERKFKKHKFMSL